MKLVSVNIERSAGSGGLLNGLDLSLRNAESVDVRKFQPICLIGPNGAGKSQFLQLIAEFFQAAWHACSPLEERRELDPHSAFSIQYFLYTKSDSAPLLVQVSRAVAEKGIAPIEVKSFDGESWNDHVVGEPLTAELLPRRIVAYTSGDNETLSLPFFASRVEYAEEVHTQALPSNVKKAIDPKEPRLMLIDYSTHLEVLVANLLLGTHEQRDYLLNSVELKDLRSVRCVIQLAHKPVRSGSSSARKSSARKGVLLTKELEEYIENLQRCSTTWSYEPDREVYIFDLWVDCEIRKAFGCFFKSAFNLYRALHKLALLNDLAISRPARQRFENDVKNRRFASRLPEPPDQDKVFRFEQVTFYPSVGAQISESDNSPVDYVSLSDGEHQLIQMLGMFAMVSEPNVLFLLDEPESHFNPRWRVEFLSKLLETPTHTGKRSSEAPSASQEVLITTHAPFLPSDMPREQVLIFERDDDDKVSPRWPDIQTFGASYEGILESCFKISPPLSGLPRRFIDDLMNSNNTKDIEDGLTQLGSSVEKILLADHLDNLKES